MTLNGNILASCQVQWGKKSLQNLTCRNVREEQKHQATSRRWHTLAVKSESKQTHPVGVVCTDAVASAITLIMQSTAVFFLFFLYISSHDRKRKHNRPRSWREHKNSIGLAHKEQSMEGFFHVTSIISCFFPSLFMQRFWYLLYGLERHEKTVRRETLYMSLKVWKEKDTNRLRCARRHLGLGMLKRSNKLRRLPNSAGINAGALLEWKQSEWQEHKWGTRGRVHVFGAGSQKS